MLNSAACKLKLKELKDAKDFCDKVLNLDPLNVKALYRFLKLVLHSNFLLVDVVLHTWTQITGKNQRGTSTKPLN